MPRPFRSIATYVRVSTDEQRDRHTVLNQRAALSRRSCDSPSYCYKPWVQVDLV